MLIKESIHLQYVTILNVYAPNNRASWYMSQKLTELKGKKDNLSVLYVAPYPNKTYSKSESLTFMKEYPQNQREIIENPEKKMFVFINGCLVFNKCVGTFGDPYAK